MSEIFSPDRHAFLAKLALRVRSLPVVKIRPAPLPSGEPRPGCRNVQKAVPAKTMSTGQRSIRASRNILHPCLTLAEAVRKAGDAYSKTQLTPFAKTLVAWIYRRQIGSLS
jgi:hypothetical protein